MSAVAAGIAAGALGAAGSVADSFVNWGVNSWLAQQQQQLNLKNAREYPAAYIEGLKAAGINPASAFGSVDLSGSTFTGSGRTGSVASGTGNLMTNAFLKALSQDKDFFKHYEKAIKSGADDAARNLKNFAHSAFDDWRPTYDDAWYKQHDPFNKL